MAKPTCFLTAVNTSTLLSPEKLKALLGDKMASDFPSNSSDRAEYMSSGVVVPNKDFLSPMSKEVFKDNEVVWMVPSSDCGNANRQKEHAIGTRFAIIFVTVGVAIGNAVG